MMDDDKDDNDGEDDDDDDDGGDNDSDGDVYLAFIHHILIHILEQLDINCGLCLLSSIHQFINYINIYLYREMLLARNETVVIGINSEINEKVTIKQCCIGNYVKIGMNSKLNNCVIMDHVVIGDNCTIQNSIICEKVMIENNCKINDCNIGSCFKVVGNSKLKSENYSLSNN